MANYPDIQPGELRTPIRIQKKVIDDEARKPGDMEREVYWIDIGAANEGTPIYRYCKWVGSHSAESISQDMQRGVKSAVITIRYNPDIDRSTCRVIYRGDIYDIDSVDDIRMRHQWMELRISRMEAG